MHRASLVADAVLYTGAADWQSLERFLRAEQVTGR
jgi:hypothetical protein